MTDPRGAWEGLRDALCQALRFAQSSADSDGLEFEGSDNSWKWEKSTASWDTKDPSQHVFRIAQASQSEFKWLETHDISLTMKALNKPGAGHENHHTWEATLEHNRVGKASRKRLATKRPPLPTFRTDNISLQIMLDSIFFGECVGGSQPKVWWKSSRSTKSVTYTFGGHGLHPAAPDGYASSTVSHDPEENPRKRAKRASVTAPAMAHCTLRARTTSVTTFLAMHASRAAAILSAQSLIPTVLKTTGDKEIVQILCEDVVFWVNFDDLVKASPVFATCFGNDQFAESKTRQYNMSLFSVEAVEQFLPFCCYGHAPKCDQYALEVAAIAHQYQTHRLLVECEIYLISELLYCDHIWRLGKIAAVAVKLELPLLLAMYGILLQDRLGKWMSVWSHQQKDMWFDVLAEMPDFERFRLKQQRRRTWNFLTTSELM